MNPRRALGHSIWFGALLLGCASSPPQTAFFYGSSPPADKLARYQRVVIEPENVPDLARLRSGGAEVYAYVSVGEAEGWRASAAALPFDMFKGENKPWNSRIPDLTDPRWKSYVLDTRIDALWAAGYRGFFLDTLDSYRMVTQSPEDRARQLSAMTDLVAEIPRRHPGARLMFNRGFELLPHVGHLASGLVAESLFEGWDAENGRYRSVPEGDRQWLLHALQQAQKIYGLPITVIDYVPPGNPELARATRQRIQGHGFAPWVATPGLDSLPLDASTP